MSSFSALKFHILFWSIHCCLGNFLWYSWDISYAGGNFPWYSLNTLCFLLKFFIDKETTQKKFYLCQYIFRRRKLRKIDGWKVIARFREGSLREKCPNTELFLVRIFLYFDWIFSPNSEKCGPEKTPYLDTFHAVDYSFGTYARFSLKLTFLISHTGGVRNSIFSENFANVLNVLNEWSQKTFQATRVNFASVNL